MANPIPAGLTQVDIPTAIDRVHVPSRRNCSIRRRCYTKIRINSRLVDSRGDSNLILAVDEFDADALEYGKFDAGQ